MALTYTWKLEALKKTTTDQFANIVIGTRWELTGTDADGVSGTFQGATPFNIEDVNGDGFITYEELTEAIVLGWIENAVVGAYREHVDGQIQKQIDAIKHPPEEVTSVFPWGTVEEVIEDKTIVVPKV